MPLARSNWNLGPARTYQHPPGHVSHNKSTKNASTCFSSVTQVRFLGTRKRTSLPGGMTPEVRPHAFAPYSVGWSWGARMPHQAWKVRLLHCSRAHGFAWSCRFMSRPVMSRRVVARLLASRFGAVMSPMLLIAWIPTEREGKQKPPPNFKPTTCVLGALPPAWHGTEV